MNEKKPNDSDLLYRKEKHPKHLNSHIGLGKKGGLRKIADIPETCLCQEHNPPSHMVYKPGVYEYVCPSCKHSTVFTVDQILC